MDKRDLEQAFSDNKKRFLGYWDELLQFQSIGVDPNHKGDCRACAEWLCKKMQEIGFSISLLETTGNPIACGTFKGEQGKPHIVFYGHYDVQPVDPIELWKSDPFDPEWHEDRLYARGAQDNKGQVIAFLQAVDALISSDALKCSLTVILDGQEESGSQGLRTSLPEWKDWLQADVLMAMDTNMAAPDVPSIVMGLRGLLSFELEVGGLKSDLHSGLHGGIVQNPAVELARLIASMFNEDGSIAIEGFYDGVKEPDAEVYELAAESPFDAAAYEKEFGVPPLGGETRFPAKIRGGLRPTLDVMGIYSGYQGVGVKTIIPASATAKLSSRLVAPQDPGYIFECVQRHVAQYAPQGLKVTVRSVEQHNPVIQDVRDARVIQDAQEVLAEMFGREAVMEWSGASIPIVADLVQTTGAIPLLVGFGLTEDNIHAPNESFSLGQLKLGFSYAMRILSKFSE